MENLGKDHPSDSSRPPSAARKGYAVPEVIITQRLRDREMLRKRREEALEKDSAQWVLRMHKSKQQKRDRGAKRGRGRGRQLAAKATLGPKPTTGPQPEQQKEAEQVHSEPAHSEPAPPGQAYQEEPPMMTIQSSISGMEAAAVGGEPAAVEGEPAARSLDLAGEEEAVNQAEAEILELLNTPLENDHQDNEFNLY